MAVLVRAPSSRVAELVEASADVLREAVAPTTARAPGRRRAPMAAPAASKPAAETSSARGRAPSRRGRRGARRVLELVSCSMFFDPMALFLLGGWRVVEKVRSRGEAVSEQLLEQLAAARRAPRRERDASRAKRQRPADDEAKNPAPIASAASGCLRMRRPWRRRARGRGHHLASRARRPGEAAPTRDDRVCARLRARSGRPSSSNSACRRSFMGSPGRACDARASGPLTERRPDLAPAPSAVAVRHACGVFAGPAGRMRHFLVSFPAARSASEAQRSRRHVACNRPG